MLGHTLLMRRFWGFRSLWSTLQLWQKARPFKSWYMNDWENIKKKKIVKSFPLTSFLVLYTLDAKHCCLIFSMFSRKNMLIILHFLFFRYLQTSSDRLCWVDKAQLLCIIILVILQPWYGKKKFVRILTELDKKKGEIRQSGFKRTCTSSANYWVKLHKCVSEVCDQQMVSLLSSFW